MKEMEIIRSERSRAGRVFMVIAILCAVATVLAWVLSYNDIVSSFNRDYYTFQEHREAGSCGDYYDKYERKCWDCEDYIAHPEKLDYFIWTLFDDVFYFAWCFVTLALTILNFLAWLRIRKCELTVTDKGITGRTVWGKRVNIPLTAITRIKKSRLMKGISVYTASGRTRFPGVKNAGEIEQVIFDLLDNGQPNKQNSLSPTYTPGQNAPARKAAEKKKKTRGSKKPVLKGAAVKQIKKYKELLDMGIISQEEFEKKKKELLDL